MQDTGKEQIPSDLELISSGVDGELGEFEIKRLGEILLRGNDGEIWQRYHLISDVLRGHFPAQIRKDFATNVMTEVVRIGQPDGQVTSAPRPSSRPGRFKHALRFAIAASVAVIAITVVQQTRLNSGDAIVEELALVQPDSFQVPQIAPAAAEHAEQFPIHYPAVNTQLAGAGSLGADDSLVDEDMLGQGPDMEALDPYIMNHAEVASERVMSPYMATPVISIPPSQ